jgi:hypothetical protein
MPCSHLLTTHRDTTVTACASWTSGLWTPRAGGRVGRMVLG